MTGRNRYMKCLTLSIFLGITRDKHIVRVHGVWKLLKNKYIEDYSYVNSYFYFYDENVYQLSRLQIELWGGIFCLMLYIFAIRLTLESNKKGYTLDIVQNNKLIHGKI